MSKMMDKLTGSPKAALKKAYQKAENKVLAAEGRRSIARKTAIAKAVTKKAAKTGLLAGALMATAVVVGEIRKRRLPK